MNNLMVFEGYNVEVFEYEGKVLFNPYHVGECLGLSASRVRDYLAEMNDNQFVLLKNSDVGKHDIRKLNNRGEKFITEKGVYVLVFRSKKEEALRFQDWVTDEVLPSIRQNGGYIMTDENMSDEEIMARALLVAQKTIEKKNKELEEKENQIKVLSPKANAYDIFLDRDGLIDVENFSKCLGVQRLGRNNMYKWLRDNKILMGNNIPYQQFINQKFFIIKPNGYHKEHGKIIEDFKTMITKRGIDYLLKRLAKEGYIHD